MVLFEVEFFSIFLVELAQPIDELLEKLRFFPRMGMYRNLLWWITCIILFSYNDADNNQDFDYLNFSSLNEIYIRGPACFYFGYITFVISFSCACRWNLSYYAGIPYAYLSILDYFEVFTWLYFLYHTSSTLQANLDKFIYNLIKILKWKIILCKRRGEDSIVLKKCMIINPSLIDMESEGDLGNQFKIIN